MAQVVIGDKSYEVEDLSPEAQALAQRCGNKEAQLQQAQLMVEEQTILRNQYAAMLTKQIADDERGEEEPQDVAIIPDEDDMVMEN